MVYSKIDRESYHESLDMSTQETLSATESDTDNRNREDESLVEDGHKLHGDGYANRQLSPVAVGYLLEEREDRDKMASTLSLASFVPDVSPPLEEVAQVLVEPNKAPDGGDGWVVLLGSSVTLVLLVSLGVNMPIYYRYMLERFGESAESTAWVASTHYAVKMFSSPVAGAFINRVGHRRASWIGAIIQVAGLLMSAFGPTLSYSLWGVGVICGLGSNINTMIVFSIPGKYFDKKKGKAASIQSSVGSLGVMIFPPLLTYLYNEYSWTGMIFVIAGITLNVAPLGGLFAPVESFKPRNTFTARQSVKMDVEKFGEYAIDNSDRSRSAISIKIVSVTEHPSSNSANKSTSEEDWIKWSPRARSASDSVQKIHLHDPHRKHHKNVAPPVVSEPQSCRLVRRRSSDNGDGGRVDSYRKRSASETFRPHRQLNTTCNDRDSLSGENLPKDNSNVRSGQSRRSGLDRRQSDTNKTPFLFCQAGRVFQFCKTHFNLSLLLIPEFSLYCVILGVFAFAQAVGNTFLAVMAKQKGLTDNQVVFMFMMTAGVMIFSKFIIGFIADLKPFRKYHQFLWASLGAITGVTIGLLPLMPEAYSFIVLANVFKCAFSMCHVIHLIYMVEIVKAENVVSAIGLERVFVGVAMLVGPVIGGALRDTLDSYDFVFYIFSLVVVSSSIIFIIIHVVWLLRERQETFDPKNDV